jgi:hypothetical protein
MSRDPLEGTSLAGFAGDLRAGKRSREAITSACLDVNKRPRVTPAPLGRSIA